MLKQYEDLGQVYLEANNLTILPNNKQEEEEKTKAVAESLLNIRLAYGKKTDFIKIVSAMYDCKIFVGLDGKSLTNKQKLMDAFGEFLDEDFTKYSTFLSQAKDRGIDVFMKPLKDLELAFKAYLNFTVKK